MKMDIKIVCVVVASLALQIIGASDVTCPSDHNCVCGGTLAFELTCRIDDHLVKINLLPNTYINIKCENSTYFDYKKLPQCANRLNTFKSVSFKDCPLPESSFKDVLTRLGVTKTMALIFQNTKKLSGYFDRKHFAGLQDLTKLLLSINGITHLPDNLFMDINNLTWLNIRSNSINLTEELFKPLEKLETLEISHNHMTNISSNLFSHLSFLRKLSLWQSNVTWFSKDLFTGVDALEELDLSSNGLNELPVSIFKPLKKLKKLTLFSNKFSSLPQNLFKNNEELETVVILNNNVKLIELPKYFFGGLPNLRQIYVQRSRLEKLPYDVFANSPLITNISLAYNDIKILPEAIFNDQINLLELDLSHNELNDLEPKLFSSLVRLEKLNLAHNSLVTISGSTFSSLLSLIYLNMEHNKLWKINTYLFSNNKQRMSISLAYNQLNFEEKQAEIDDCKVKVLSPFAHTYNLRLLNLSHNIFNIIFEDWWMNGHDNIDISNNNIKFLWDDMNEENTLPSIRHHVKKPMKQVWVSNNPIACVCQNFFFLDYITNDLKTEIVDVDQIDCVMLEAELCFDRLYILVAVVLCLASIYFVAQLIYKNCGMYIVEIIKLKFRGCVNGKKEIKPYNLLMKYNKRDEIFFLEDFLPSVFGETIVDMSIDPEAEIDYDAVLYSYVNNIVNKPLTIIVFSPNYLTAVYKNVDIKKIHSEMLKAKNTLYVFVDQGPDNSIYAFLKEQRDKKNSIIWGEYNSVDKLMVYMDSFPHPFRSTSNTDFEHEQYIPKPLQTEDVYTFLADTPKWREDLPHTQTNI